MEKGIIIFSRKVALFKERNKKMLFQITIFGFTMGIEVKNISGEYV